MEFCAAVERDASGLNGVCAVIGGLEGASCDAIGFGGGPCTTPVFVVYRAGKRAHTTRSVIMSAESARRSTGRVDR